MNIVDVTTNSAPSVTIQAGSSYAQGTVLNGSNLFSASDPDGASDIDYIKLYDANTTGGGVWRYNGSVITPGGEVSGGYQFEYGNRNLLTYTVGVGTNDFVFEAFDDAGEDSNDAVGEITGTATNSASSVTIEAGSSYAAGTVLTGTDLISVTDPDGSSDIQNILVYDASDAPGAVWRFNGTVIDPEGAGNQFELNYDNLDLLTYTVGTGTDQFSFEARDFSGNISNEATHTINSTLAPSADDVREGTDTSASLTEGTWRTGTIDAEPVAGDGPGSQSPASDGRGGFVDKDWYRVTLDADRTYSFDAQSLSLTTGVVFARLYDSAGNEVGGSTEGEGVAPNFTYSTAGQSGSDSYYLAVSAGDTNDIDFRTATGDFRVRFIDSGAVATTDVAADTSTGATLAVGATVLGEIQQDDVSGDYIDADYFRVTLTGGQRYTFSADSGVDGGDTLDEVFIRLRDAQGNTLSPDIRDEDVTPEFIFDAPGSGSQTFYLAISAGGGGAWWDDTGAYSVSLTGEGTVPQPVNYRPLAQATDYIGDRGDVVPLTDLFDYSDPDGLSDIVSFAVQDRTSLGGHLTYLGEQMDPNVVYERPIDQIGDWAFVVGPPGTDYVGFNAIDGEGAFNTSVVASVSGAQVQGPTPLASAEDLFGQLKLSVLAQFALAAYPKNEAALIELERDGWSVIEWVDPASSSPDTGVKYFENQNASALAVEAPDGKSIVLAITGTNSAWDKPEDQTEWFDMPAHYAKLVPFFNQLNLSSYDSVYVTGHSLGAAMTEAFIIEQRGDPRFEGVALANPGFNSFEVPQLPNMSSFVIEGDIIRVPDLVPAQVGGKEISGDEYVLKNNFFSDVVSTAPRATALNLHEVELYVEAAKSLDRSSPFILENQYDLRKDERPYSIYLESLLIGANQQFSVAGSPGSTVSPETVVFGPRPEEFALGEDWTFSTDKNDRSTLTIDASAFTNTGWTIGAEGSEAVLSDAARQELLRSSGFGSLQINSSWADLDLTIEELEGTSILNETVYVSAGVGNDNIDGSATDRRIVATGRDGDDTLMGGGSPDILRGGIGRDDIHGGGGLRHPRGRRW